MAFELAHFTHVTSVLVAAVYCHVLFGSADLNAFTVLISNVKGEGTCFSSHECLEDHLLVWVSQVVAKLLYEDLEFFGQLFLRLGMRLERRSEMCAVHLCIDVVALFKSELAVWRSDQINDRGELKRNQFVTF